MSGGPAILPEPAEAPGAGAVVFRRAGERTVVAAARAQSPLRLLTPRNHGDAAWLYLSTLGGGLVDADAYRLSLTVESGARAFVSTQGATRGYRSSAGTRSDLQAQVGEDALLIYAPDPLSLFAGARFAQELDLALAPTASLALVDVVTAGRVAMGERWSFSEYHSRVRLTCGGAPIAEEAVRLDPAQGPLRARLGRFEAVGMVVLAGPLVREAAKAAALKWETAPLERGAPLRLSASPVGEAWWFRLAATRVETLTHAVRDLLSFLPALLGDDPFVRRP